MPAPGLGPSGLSQEGATALLTLQAPPMDVTTTPSARSGTLGTSPKRLRGLAA